MTCVHGGREGHCEPCGLTAVVGAAGGHDDDDGPPELVLHCEACGAEEPAPIDAVPGKIIDCAYCGELAEVEVR